MIVLCWWLGIGLGLYIFTALCASSRDPWWVDALIIISLWPLLLVLLGVRLWKERRV